MPQRMKIKRETPRLLQYLSEIIGEGLHTSFRKMSEHPAAGRAHVAIRKMDGLRWHTVCRGCAKTVVQFGLQHPWATNSAHNRDKLAFVLAKRSMQELKKLKKSPSCPAHELLVAVKDMTFKEYREMLGSLVDELLVTLAEPQEACPNCRHVKRYNEQCPDCDEFRCEVHCKCSTGEKRARRKTS